MTIQADTVVVTPTSDMAFRTDDDVDIDIDSESDRDNNLDLDSYVSDTTSVLYDGCFQFFQP